MALDSAPRPQPERARGHEQEDAPPRRWVMRPEGQGEQHDQGRLDDRDHGEGDVPRWATAPHRRDEEAVHDAGDDVVDEAHARPAGRGERRHDDHPGREEVDVGAGVEAGDLGDRLEQRAEEQQPDDRLDQGDDELGGLAQQAQNGAGS